MAPQLPPGAEPTPLPMTGVVATAAAQTHPPAPSVRQRLSGGESMARQIRSMQLASNAASVASGTSWDQRLRWQAEQEQRRLQEASSSNPRKIAVVPSSNLAKGGITLPSMSPPEATPVGAPAALGSVALTDPATTRRRKSNSYSAASQATIQAQGLKPSPASAVPSAVVVESEGDAGRNVSLTLVADPLVPNPLPGGAAAKTSSCRGAVTVVKKQPTAVGSQNSTRKYRRVAGVGSKPKVSPPAARPSRSKSLSCPSMGNVSPQSFLDSLLSSRGYSTKNYCSLEGGYYCKPTPLQKASYGIQLVRAVRSSNAALLGELLRCGLSRNPCNAFGESLVHMVCRRSDYALLKALVEHGCSLQVSDDFGRTPLHDACWTSEPCFECIELILLTDKRLLRLVDCRGSSPLAYVQKDNWRKWIDFFERKKDVYWPTRDVANEGEERPPRLAGEAPHSNPIQDPKDALSLEVAAMVASGQIGPDDAMKKDGAGKLESLIGERSNEIVHSSGAGRAVKA